MSEENYTYQVKCRTCKSTFDVQLFDSHERNLFMVDKKDWYCDKCKKEYFKRKTSELSAAHQAIGFDKLTGSAKMISWAEKIRAELINKVNYLKNSLSFNNDTERSISDKAFEIFLEEWQQETNAKWWIDNRKMNVRDISKRIEEISDAIKSDHQ
jgi:hypothetical protein